MSWPMPPEWSAFWTAVLALAAVVALVVAYLQLDAVRSQWRSANRAYVLVSSAADRKTRALYFVIENAGRSHATDVSITLDPAPTSTFMEEGLDSEAVWNPTLLPPGYSYRTGLDFAPDRTDADLPMEFIATVQWRSPSTDRDEIITGTYTVDFTRFFAIREWELVDDTKRKQINYLKSIADSLKTIAQMRSGR